MRALGGVAICAWLVACSSAAAPPPSATQRTSVLATIDECLLRPDAAGLPDGAYRTTITAEDWNAVGVTDERAIEENSGEITITLADGVLSLDQVSPGTAETPHLDGRYETAGDRIEFVWIGEEAGSERRECLRWQPADGGVTFTPVSPNSLFTRVLYGTRPWLSVEP